MLIQKYGGATLADPTKIKTAAQNIALLAQKQPLIVIVSAMGKTTNSLIDLAHQVSPQPLQREMDMLLSVGERISMSLLSMALNDLGCPAISFTGSQAGILTNNSHVNALIEDIKPLRVKEALELGKVAIIAGFQGVSPQTKEITTLGRGGSDTSALALAAHFNCRCEILKDVPAVYTADPQDLPLAKPLAKLNYDQLLEMTFWGAKVLHYRSVEIARAHEVDLYIGLAHQQSEGTQVRKDLNMYESTRFIALNSHSQVFQIAVPDLGSFKKFLLDHQVPYPQILHLEPADKGLKILVTAPSENLQDMQKVLSKQNTFQLLSTDLSTATMTCSGTTNLELFEKFMRSVQDSKLNVRQVLPSGMSFTAVVEMKDLKLLKSALHSLIALD